MSQITKEWNATHPAQAAVVKWLEDAGIVEVTVISGNTVYTASDRLYIDVTKRFVHLYPREPTNQEFTRTICYDDPELYDKVLSVIKASETLPRLGS